MLDIVPCYELRMSFAHMRVQLLRSSKEIVAPCWHCGAKYCTLSLGVDGAQMPTYNVLTTIVAGGLAEQPEQARLESARAKGYSVAQLGPGSAHPLEEELLETWLLLEVRECQRLCRVPRVDTGVGFPWLLRVWLSNCWHQTPMLWYWVKGMHPQSFMVAHFG